ncbi:MAG: glycerophosphodiester phosphodiesterase family protein [Bacilli bacterium]|nr:glycerophosphodiester phosphodiesterase family protein [Bacilli bacterium]
MFEKGRIISHRGIHNNIDIYENTLESIKLALDKDYIIEIDVHIIKDNQIIVFHDYNTKRLLKKDLIVEDITYEEINNQDIFHVPTIQEVLELVDGKVPLLIEIKQLRKVGHLEEELMNILNDYKGEYAIQSFNPKVLLWFKKNYPNIQRGQLSYSYKRNKFFKIKKLFLKSMFLNFLTKPNFISYKYNELSERKIKKLKKKNIKVLGWTVKSKKDFKKYSHYYDNLICEDFINGKCK